MVRVKESDIKAALLLLNDVRRMVVLRGIDPVALRIALKFILKVDDEFAKQKLTAEEEEAINKYVEGLYKIGGDRYRGLRA